MSAIDLTPPSGEETTEPGATGLLRAAARSHQGNVRPHNEDAFVCRPDLGLFAAIDGMGGQQGGRQAADLACEALLDEGDPAAGLVEANQRIFAAARDRPELQGMGCVASALKIEDGVARIAHVGDTRVYLALSAGCEQLTRDHTVAASEQERLGLSHRRAGRLPGRNQVTRDLGGQERRGEDWIDRLEVPLEKDALLLLCSDGLPAAVGAGALFERLRQAHRARTPPAELADELIELALEKGAADNVTAVVVRHEGEVVLPDMGGTLAGARAAWLVARRTALPFLLGAALGFVLRGCLAP